MGVTRAKSGRFQATIRVADFWASIGTYETIEEARAATEAEYARVKDGSSIFLRRSGEVLDKRAYAARIGVPPGTLGRWATEGMPTLKVGNGSLRFDVALSDEWIAKHHPRSVSFARESIVYFFRRDTDSAIKIGFTSDVIRRASELRKEGYAVVLLAAVPGDKPLELRIQGMFSEERIDKDDEWFRPSARLLEFVGGFGRRAA